MLSFRVACKEGLCRVLPSSKRFLRTFVNIHNVRKVDLNNVVLSRAVYPPLRLASIKEVQRARLIVRMVIGMI